MMLLQDNYGWNFIGSAPFGRYIAVALRKAIDVERTVWLSDQVRSNLKLPEDVTLLDGYPAERMTNVCDGKPNCATLHELPQILLGEVAQPLCSGVAVFVPQLGEREVCNVPEVVLHKVCAQAVCDA